MQSTNRHAPIRGEVDVVLVKQRVHMLRLQAHTHTHTHTEGRWRSAVARDLVGAVRLRSDSQQADATAVATMDRWFILW